MENTDIPKVSTKPRCSGCGRNEIHKLCPAWGTKYYMSGELFTPEMEKELFADRELKREEYYKNNTFTHLD